MTSYIVRIRKLTKIEVLSNSNINSRNKHLVMYIVHQLLWTEFKFRAMMEYYEYVHIIIFWFDVITVDENHYLERKKRRGFQGGFEWPHYKSR